MATATQFLTVANSQLGVGEDPPGSNHNKFTDWYGMNGYWCAMFQSWCFAQVGMRNIRTSWCDDFITHAMDRSWGVWVGPYDPIRPADLAIFDWDGGSTDHVAAVFRVLDNGQWESIEGNWQDRVARVLRNRQNLRGFFRPTFTAESRPPTPVPTLDGVVRRYQLQLCAYLIHTNQAPIAVDGIAGPVTIGALKKFQAFCNTMYAMSGNSARIAVDGVYGAKTAALLDWWTVVFVNPKPKRLPVPSGVPNLMIGCPSGDRVRMLQTALNRVMKSGLFIDGVYGPKTRDSVKLYQTWVHIHNDGVYGPLTASHLGAEKALTL